MINLVLIGNGGHARDIEQIVRDINYHRPTYNILAHLDDSLLLNRTGSIESFKDYLDCQYSICVNDGKVRAQIDRRLIEIAINKRSTLKPANLIHPTAFMGSNCVYLDGIVMGPYSVITTNVRLGTHVHLNSHASINQNSMVGSYSTMSPGARVCGDCEIGEEVNMGANSVVINVKEIGNRVTIGAGAVVINDVPDDTTVVGVPAKPTTTKETVWG